MLNDLRVCFVGDSFVAGIGDAQHLGWVGRVARRTHQSGQSLTSYVLGVRGQTSQDIAARWWGECAARLPPDCDGRVVVAFGVNDTTLVDGATRVPAADSPRHLDLLLSDARAVGWSTLVVGPPPVADPVQNERISRLDQAFALLCAAADTGYVPVFQQLSADPVWMRQVANGDGAHPGADGYQRLADLVWPQWQLWVTTKPGKRTTGPDGYWDSPRAGSLGAER